MFPTHVGMNRRANCPPSNTLHVPHTRGDEPRKAQLQMAAELNVPHTRGDEPLGPRLPRWPLDMFPTHVGMNRRSVTREGSRPRMFPTHVGMNRILVLRRQIPRHVPHTRGDEPYIHADDSIDFHMFPTHVGMNRD